MKDFEYTITDEVVTFSFIIRAKCGYLADEKFATFMAMTKNIRFVKRETL